MERDEIARRLTAGTTTKAEKLNILFHDEKIVLVKYPGGNVHHRCGKNYVPGHIDCFLIDDILEYGFRFSRKLVELPKGSRFSPTKELPALLKEGMRYYREKNGITEKELSIDTENLEKLYKLSTIPYESGKQFITVFLRLGSSLRCGEISYGFNHKLTMGTLEFESLEEAIMKVEQLIRTYGDPAWLLS